MAFERGGGMRTIELLDLTTGGVRDRLPIPGHGRQALLYGRFRPDGTVLSVESDYQGDVTVWEVGTGKLLATLPDHSKAHWSPDGRYLVAFCSVGWVDMPGGGRSKGGENHVRVYEVAALPARARLDRPADRISFNADGTELAAADTVWRVTRVGGRPRLVRAAQAGDRLTTFFDAGGRRWTFPLRQTLKPDTPFVLERAGPDPRAVTFPGRPDLGLKGTRDAGRIEELVVTPDGKRAVLVWYGNKTRKGETGSLPWSHLEAWDLDGPRLRGLWAEANGSGEFQSLTLSPDGTRLATAGNRGFQVWDTETGQRLTPEYNRGRALLRQVAFAADGQHVIAGYDHGWVALLRLDGEKVVEHQAHEGDVTAVAAGPDGRYAVSAADDRTLTVWDAKTLTRLAHWVAADAKITAVAFAPDGRTLAVGDAKGVVQVWDVPAVLEELNGLGFGTAGGGR
jgi:WD40 repeat protein